MNLGCVKLLLIALAIFIVPNILWAKDKVNSEATEAVRSTAAKAQLQANTGVVSIYVKGMCCESCAIGVRKKISKLKFVDKERFKNGVDIDAKTQLALVALRQGQSPNIAALAKAVDDAGFDPVNLYRLNKGRLQTTPLVIPAK